MRNWHYKFSQFSDLSKIIAEGTGCAQRSALETENRHRNGRALVEEVQRWTLPGAIRESGDEFVDLARACKQINAPSADLGRTSLQISTRALALGRPGSDTTYITLENQLSNITLLRDTLASQILQLLDDAEFHGKQIPESKARELVQEAEGLLDIVHAIAANQ
jgi:hypothetical protein